MCREGRAAERGVGGGGVGGVPAAGRCGGDLGGLSSRPGPRRAAAAECDYSAAPRHVQRGSDGGSCGRSSALGTGLGPHEAPLGTAGRLRSGSPGRRAPNPALRCAPPRRAEGAVGGAEPLRDAGSVRSAPRRERHGDGGGERDGSGGAPGVVAALPAAAAGRGREVGAARLGSVRFGSVRFPAHHCLSPFSPQERTPPPPAAPPPAPQAAPRRSPQLRVLLTPLPAPGRRLPQKRLLGAYDGAAGGDGKRRRAEPSSPERADSGSDGDGDGDSDSDSDGTEAGQVGADIGTGGEGTPPCPPPLPAARTAGPFSL